MAGLDVATNEPRVVGINLLQPEDAPIAVRDFSLQMRMIDYLRPLYPKPHITLHAGELADGLVPPEVLRFHVRESVEKGHAERIGHGTSAMQEDDLRPDARAAKKVLPDQPGRGNHHLGVKGNPSADLRFPQCVAAPPFPLTTMASPDRATLEFLKPCRNTI